MRGLGNIRSRHTTPVIIDDVVMAMDAEYRRNVAIARSHDLDLLAGRDRLAGIGCLQPDMASKDRARAAAAPG